MKDLVIGLGISGKASAAFLLKSGRKVIGADKKAESLKSEPLVKEGLELIIDQGPFPKVDRVILSPGVSPEHPWVKEAKRLGIEVVGEIELALRHLKNRCVGVTGTNGKTTTVLLIAHILNSAKIPALALGNVGDSLSGYLLEPNRGEVLVLELSSFQLETMESKCLEAAALLNITPDHLDRYASMKEYADAKFRIGKCVKAGGKFWVSKAVKEIYGGEGEVFDPSAEYAPWSDEKIAAISMLRYIQLGVPEKQNVQAAYQICKGLGVSDLEFRRGLETFRKPAHRIEWVDEKNGVTFYNDSKATNIDSVMHAVSLFEGPLILLAGGYDKGASYKPWIDCFQSKVKMIIAFGGAASKIEAELKDAFRLTRVGTLDEAVRLAAIRAEKGDSILLSPGCSSYDQFRNYEHRGDEFKRLVKGLV
ncbi:MAG: UDP-N-acetylmuramoyl-L-alanine--D-glutamate ligase [Verrucomicrobia bacterium]|nr:UDP-N-acetylmuramoyl-L-alanine--D-glutamate ligase [Verrucomicrobiota bacterium]